MSRNGSQFGQTVVKYLIAWGVIGYVAIYAIDRQVEFSQVCILEYRAARESNLKQWQLYYESLPRCGGAVLRGTITPIPDSVGGTPTFAPDSIADPFLDIPRWEPVDVPETDTNLGEPAPFPTDADRGSQFAPPVPEWRKRKVKPIDPIPAPQPKRLPLPIPRRPSKVAALMK